MKKPHLFISVCALGLTFALSAFAYQGSGFPPSSSEASVLDTNEGHGALCQEAHEEDTGSPLTEQTGVQTVTIEVDEVSCASCSLTIRKSLKKLSGIQKISKGKSKKLVVIEFESGEVKVTAILHAIEEAGFNARIVGN